MRLALMWYAYTDDQQMERVVTIENSSSFARKLNLLERYQVTQVMVRDADSGDVDPDLWEVARQFQTGGGVNTAPAMLKISFRIFHPDGGVMEEVTVPIENPVHTFMAPAGAGDIHVEAQVVQISELWKQHGGQPAEHGSVEPGDADAGGNQHAGADGHA